MQTGSLPQIASAAPTRVRRLDNGLTVVVRQHRASPVVAIVTHVRAGYFDEPDEIAGISHVLEHMYFKGTPSRGPGEIGRQTRALGGMLNASTSYDQTRYHTVLPADALQQGMEIQSDALKHALIDEDELRRELRVIIEEAKRKRDSATALARETLYETLFDVHRIRRWRIGTEEALAGFRREQVFDYYRNRYRPEAITLAIAGDIEFEHAFDLAARCYGDLRGVGPAPAPGPEEPERRGFRYREISGDITRTYINWGWRGPATGHVDVPALDLLGIILGQGRASRLYSEVRESGRALAVGAGLFDTTEIGVFSLAAEARPATAASTLDATAESLARLHRYGVLDDEVQRARAVQGARLLRFLETAEGHANFLAQWQSLGDWQLGARYLERIESVDAADIDAVARRWLAPDCAAVLVYRPDSAPAETRPPDVLLAELFAGSTDAPASVPLRTPALLAGSPIEPEHEEDGVRFYRAGAVRIAVQPRAGSGLASIAVAGAGAINETPAVAGIARLVARTSLKGTVRRDATSIAAESEDLGASVQAHADADVADWRLTVPAHAVDQGLELLTDVAFHPVFPDEAFYREREVALEDVRNVRDDMVGYPFALLLAAAFPDHPYGFSLETLEASLHDMQPGALSGWHTRRIMGDDLWILIVGDVDADRVAGRAAALVDAHAPRPDRQVPEPISWPARPLERVALMDRAQTALAVGLPGPRRATEDHYALQLAASAIGGLGGRLFEELRSRRSLAYSVSVSTLGRRYGGAFIGYIATSPDREEEARSQLLLEMLRLSDAGVAADELERARRYALGAWSIRRQTTSALLSDLIGALVIGAGLEEIRRFPDRVAAVSIEGIRDAASRWLDPDLAVFGIVRGKAAPRP